MVLSGIINEGRAYKYHLWQYSQKSQDIAECLCLMECARSTRLMLNGEVGYSDMRSREIDARNYGWHGNLNLGWQQNLPWQLKWSVIWNGCRVGTLSKVTIRV